MKMFGILVALLLAVSSFKASGTQIRFTGIFSDLRYGAESGDLIGTEIFIFRADDGFQAFVQAAEGEPGVAVVTPITMKGTTISFTVPEPSHGAGFYEGHVTSEGFVGIVKVKRGEQLVELPFKLPRKNSYWQ